MLALQSWSPFILVAEPQSEYLCMLLRMCTCVFMRVSFWSALSFYRVCVKPLGLLCLLFLAGSVVLQLTCDCEWGVMLHTMFCLIQPCCPFLAIRFMVVIIAAPQRTCVNLLHMCHQMTYCFEYVPSFSNSFHHLLAQWCFFIHARGACMYVLVTCWTSTMEVSTAHL